MEQKEEKVVKQKRTRKSRYYREPYQFLVTGGDNNLYLASSESDEKTFDPRKVQEYKTSIRLRHGDMIEVLLCGCWVTTLVVGYMGHITLHGLPGLWIDGITARLVDQNSCQKSISSEAEILTSKPSSVLRKDRKIV